MSKNFKFFSLAFSLVLCFAVSALGQQTTGEIQGTVKDPNGAVVPNASITIKGVTLGFNRTVQTDSEGVFRAREIPPGTFTVSLAATS